MNRRKIHTISSMANQAASNTKLVAVADKTFGRSRISKSAQAATAFFTLGAKIELLRRGLGCLTDSHVGMRTNVCHVLRLSLQLSLQLQLPSHLPQLPFRLQLPGKATAEQEVVEQEAREVVGENVGEKLKLNYFWDWVADAPADWGVVRQNVVVEVKCDQKFALFALSVLPLLIPECPALIVNLVVIIITNFFRKFAVVVDFISKH